MSKKISSFKVWRFDLNLTWTWAKYENECHHRILRPKWPLKHVLHDTRSMFLSGGFIRPGIYLALCLALPAYLYSIFVFSSVTLWQNFGFRLSLVWSRQPIRRKESTLTWNWPDIWPFKEKLKTALECSRWDLSITALHSSLRLSKFGS